MFVIQYRIKVDTSWNEWKDYRFAESARAAKFIYGMYTEVLGDSMYEYRVARRTDGVDEAISMKVLEMAGREEGDE